MAQNDAPFTPSDVSLPDWPDWPDWDGFTSGLGRSGQSPKGSESEVGEKCTADPLCIAFHQADSGAYRVFCKESNTKTSALCSSDGDGAVDVTEGMLGEPQATNVKNHCLKKGDEALSAQKCMAQHLSDLLGFPYSYW